jgi:hypothetical protein
MHIEKINAYRNQLKNIETLKSYVQVMSNIRGAT